MLSSDLPNLSRKQGHKLHVSTWLRMARLESEPPSDGWGQHFCIISVRSSPHLDAWGDVRPCSERFLNTSAPSSPVWDTIRLKVSFEHIWASECSTKHKGLNVKNLKHAFHFLECYLGHQVLNRVMICGHVGFGKKFNQVITLTLKGKRRSFFYVSFISYKNFNNLKYLTFFFHCNFSVLKNPI